MDPMFGIRKAIGLGMTILILKFLMSGMFMSFESVMTTLFTTAEEVISSVEIESQIAAPGIHGLTE